MKRLAYPVTVLFLLFFGCSQNTNTHLTQKITGQGNRHLTYTLAPKEIWVGVPVTLNLEMKGEKGDDVIFPKAESLDLPENLRLIEAKTDDNRLKLTVKADKSGEYTIPPLSVLFEGKEENVELLTRPMVFTVISLIEEGSEKSLSGLWTSMRIGFLPFWQVLVFLLIILMTGLFLFWLLYWRKRVKITPPEPVWSLLERELSRLTSEDMLLEQDRGRFYDLSSSLVKKALDGVYELHTGEQTREEFTSSLVNVPDMEGEVKLWLGRFFERADLVRFARIEEDGDKWLSDLDEVVRFTGQAIKKARELPGPQQENHKTRSERGES